jgi:hypothetical protein
MNDVQFDWVLSAMILAVLAFVVPSIYRRIKAHLPIFPRATSDALFLERNVFCRNLLGNSWRGTEADNCSMVIIAGNQLLITPMFPGNLFVRPVRDFKFRIGLADILCLETNNKLLRKSIRSIVVRTATQAVDIHLKNPEGFMQLMRANKVAQ